MHTKLDNKVLQVLLLIYAYQYQQGGKVAGTGDIKITQTF
jgi:hypothetical protein